MRTAAVWLAVAVVLGAVAAGGLAVWLHNRPADTDLSVACGGGTGLLVPRCFGGGVTVDDFRRSLVDLGYDCVLLRGMEHSSIRCSRSDVGASSAARLNVDIEGTSGPVPLVEAEACGTVPDDRVRAMFETVLSVSFARDPSLARQAMSWIEANRDGRTHDLTLGGYSLTLRRTDCERLWIYA